MKRKNMKIVSSKISGAGKTLKVEGVFQSSKMIGVFLFQDNKAKITDSKLLNSEIEVIDLERKQLEKQIANECLLLIENALPFILQEPPEYIEWNKQLDSYNEIDFEGVTRYLYLDGEYKKNKILWQVKVTTPRGVVDRVHVNPYQVRIKGPDEQKLYEPKDAHFKEICDVLSKASKINIEQYATDYVNSKTEPLYIRKELPASGM